jgi:cobalt-precorrin 5A hydrolase/precorrin-3B C17-methyltransferase
MTAVSAENKRIAIVLLGNGSMAAALNIQVRYPQAQIFGLQNRVDSADIFYEDFGATLRDLYQNDTAIIALCAAGIVIRTLAPLLTQKNTEPPVLAVAEDGSAVVPLLGGLGGVNTMAREISAIFGVPAAITTSGELRFGQCLLNPPAGYALADIEQGKRFVSDLLGGETVRIDGEAPWLVDAHLPLSHSATRSIKVTTAASGADVQQLVIHPRRVVALIHSTTASPADNIARALAAMDVAQLALACLVARITDMPNVLLQQAAQALNVPLRFVADLGALWTDLSATVMYSGEQVTLIVADQSIDPKRIGRPRGCLTVIGLGPGATEFMVPAAKMALVRAEDILGYETYVTMAGPFRPEQKLHCSDNREEMLRARHAFELAASGRNVVVVSSGDPGVFAMAAAVLEALHESDNAQWHAVDLQIYPGVSAALATAARAGAPLGHDFCVMSLSDNLKPWATIEKRLDHAAAADFALAFYNPISKARPWQLGRALDIIRQHRSETTVVVLGRDIGRPGETLTTTTLAQLQPDQVDMRTLVIVGSSLTQRFLRSGYTQDWVYTPRWYK